MSRLRHCHAAETWCTSQDEKHFSPLAADGIARCTPTFIHLLLPLPRSLCNSQSRLPSPALKPTANHSPSARRRHLPIPAQSQPSRPSPPAPAPQVEISNCPRNTLLNSGACWLLSREMRPGSRARGHSWRVSRRAVGTNGEETLGKSGCCWTVSRLDAGGIQATVRVWGRHGTCS